MICFKDKIELSRIIQKIKLEGKSIGFIPTMGAIHEGHLELVRRSRSCCDFSVASIFVNPLQFNDIKDYLKYPSSLNIDLKMLEAQNCDLVYAPHHASIYPTQIKTEIGFGEIEARVEGRSRPKHFKGVALVLIKLFNLVQPHKVFLGLKDIQQFQIVRQMVRDLNYDIEVVGVETQREVSGLALSSRNQLLTENGKDIASNIFKALNLGKKVLVNSGQPTKAVSAMKNLLASIDGLDIEYCEIIDTEDFNSFENLSLGKDLAICVAVKIEGVRLIDNLYIPKYGITP